MQTSGLRLRRSQSRLRGFDLARKIELLTIAVGGQVHARVGDYCQRLPITVAIDRQLERVMTGWRADAVRVRVAVGEFRRGRIVQRPDEPMQSGRFDENRGK